VPGILVWDGLVAGDEGSPRFPPGVGGKGFTGAGWAGESYSSTELSPGKDSFSFFFFTIEPERKCIRNLT
jgi:hypothetical protein